MTIYDKVAAAGFSITPAKSNPQDRLDEAYVLRDPDGEVFLRGATRDNLEERIIHHLSVNRHQRIQRQDIDNAVAALRATAGLVQTARQYFPKSISNHDRFELEQTCASVGAALARLEALASL